MSRARSGGGILSRQTTHYQDRKTEPRVNPVSVGAVSRLGAKSARAPLTKISIPAKQPHRSERRRRSRDPEAAEW